jgi:hypothetical protein
MKLSILISIFPRFRTANSFCARQLMAGLRGGALVGIAGSLFISRAWSQNCDPAPSGLVSWWGAEGNATDWIGTNNGTLIGGLTFTNGEVGQAFQFDGTSGYVSVPASTSLDVGQGQGLTIETWINPADAQLRPLVEWNNGSGGYGVHFWINQPTPFGSGPGCLYANVVDATGQGHSFASTAGLVVTNSFQHVALTYDRTSGVAELYYNSVLVGVQYIGKFALQTSYPLYFGYRPSGDDAGTLFDGTMDEISLYNRALTGREIEGIYHAGRAGKCNGPSLVITSQPQSQIVLPGANVTFSVTATGPAPLSYQWQFNGTNLPNLITTVAGNGTFAYSGDGGAATNASMNTPYGTAVDATGNLFIADAYNNRVRKVAVNGVITTIAGNGVQGYSGDGGAATNASLNRPFRVAVDTSGNVFLTDSGNARVRKVDINGIITTVAGNGSHGYSGDGGAATNAKLSTPCDVAVGTSSNLFFSDYGNNTVRKVAANGIITTVAGNGTKSYSGDGGPATNASLNSPNGMTVDNSGHVFIADFFNNRIREVGTDGIIRTIAGNGTQGYSGDGGPATNASLNQISGVAVDDSGNLFLAQSGNDVVREVNAGGIITTVAGDGTTGYSGDGGPATNANLHYPTHVTLQGSSCMFIVDCGNSVIRKVVLNSSPTLTIDNVTASNAGNYSVIVSDPDQIMASSVATLTVLTPGSCLPPPSGLVGWWPGEGSAIDIAGTNNGILNGGVTFAPGEVGQAFQLDGQTGYVRVPAATNLDVGSGGGFTIEGWINPANVESNQPIVEWNANTDDSGIGVHLWISLPAGFGSGPGCLFANLKSPGQNFILYSGPGVVTNGGFQHVALSYDKASRLATLYYNGGVVAQAISPYPNYTPATTADLYFGERIAENPSTIGTAGTMFGGLMDEISLYKVALSSNQIQGIFEAGSAGKCQEPVIAGEPENQVGYWGGDIVLSVNATGSAPLSYQWEVGGVPIPDATNAMLVLSDLQFTNAGAYTVVISNSYGVTTSAPALLTVSPASVSIALYSGLTIGGQPGFTYGIQYNSSLTNNNGWVGLTNLTFTGTNELWYEPQSASLPHRYYRVVPGPIPIP